MLDGLFVTPAVTAITEALASTKADGTLAVVGNARLATALAARHDVIPVALSARAARKLPSAIADLATVEPASLAAVIVTGAAVIATGAAVIATGLATDADWEATIRGWSRVVRDGGAIVFVDRGHPHEASRRALCGGLTEIEQRRAGRSVITSGLVSHLG